ncbi:MAG: hypothetical protein IT317_11140 [Anaerolineales bacterium]|nr:hypothetical protein [Anaerolineales bacterium]
MKRGVVMLGLALAALLAVGAAARPAYAAGCDNDKRVMGGSYSLPAGEVLDSNLIVLGGSASIAAGATVQCALVVVGGSADVAGSVAGDVVVFSGDVTLQSTAVIGGELATIGGTVNRAEGAVVTGGESQGLNFGDGQRWPTVVTNSPFYGLIAIWEGVFQTFIAALVMGLLALLVIVFWPEQTNRVAAAITNAPAATGGLGLLTLVAVPVLLVLVTITICLIPVALVAAVIFAAAIILGWIALGQIVGARLAAALSLRQLSPAAAAALGTGALWVATSAVGQLPCIGWVAWVVLSAAGLGAVTLTRFGTRPYLPAPFSSAPPAASSEPLPPAPPEVPADAPDAQAT